MNSFCSHFGVLPARQGTHWAPVWVKSGPSLAKGSTKTSAFGEKGHLAKTMLFTRFSYCLGGPWQALGSSGRPWMAHMKQKTSRCQHRGTKVHVRSMETVANGREWMRLDANFLKSEPDQRSKSISRPRHMIRSALSIYLSIYLTCCSVA